MKKCPVSHRPIEPFSDHDPWDYAFILSKQFQYFIDKIPEAVIISDESGNVIQVNQEAEHLFEYKYNEFISLSIEDLVPKSIRKYHVSLRSEFFKQPYSRYIATERGVSLSAVKKSGSVFPMESALFSIKTDKGRLAINLLRDITTQYAREYSLQQKASHDALTKLPNRHAFEEIAQGLLEVSKHEKKKSAFIFIDLDKFKPVNDNYGHHVGDHLLLHVTKRIKSLMRKDDFLARIGGDEFVCIIYSIEDEKPAIMLSKRILEALSTPFNIMSHKINISASIGIALHEKPTMTAEQLLKLADKTMYEAKKAGRNKLMVHPSK